MQVGLREAGLTPGWGRPLETEHGTLLQYSCLENPMDRKAAWRATVHRFAQKRLNTQGDFLSYSTTIRNMFLQNTTEGQAIFPERETL